MIFLLTTFAKSFPVGEACHFKNTPPQRFSCEFSKIFKSTFFREHLQPTASTATWQVFYKHILLAFSNKSHSQEKMDPFALDLGIKN